MPRLRVLAKEVLPHVLRAEGCDLSKGRIGSEVFFIVEVSAVMSTTLSGLRLWSARKGCLEEKKSSTNPEYAA
jgi:hypothetical protein